jgi:hypothetical protein
VTLLGAVILIALVVGITAIGVYIDPRVRDGKVE